MESTFGRFDEDALRIQMFISNSPQCLEDIDTRFGFTEGYALALISSLKRKGHTIEQSGYRGRTVFTLTEHGAAG